MMDPYSEGPSTSDEGGNNTLFLDLSHTTLSPSHLTQPSWIATDGERAEIVYLSLVGTVATALNTIVFIRLLKQSRTCRTPTAQTSFMAGPYHISSFTLFKLNLCITDFLILLVHTFGKIIWLTVYHWPWGNAACKIYSLLSIFSFYANSNVIVAIGVDRLKVVYTSHIQGAASVRRVRWMVWLAWLTAALCSLPQLYIWQTFDVDSQLVQCVDKFEIMRHQNTSTAEWQRWEIAYELFHQTAVFWLPFVVLAVSYLLISLRLLHFTFRPVHCSHVPRSSTSVSSSSRLLHLLDMRPRAEKSHYHQLLRENTIAMDSFNTPRTVTSTSIHSQINMDGPSNGRSADSMHATEQGIFNKISRRTPLLCSANTDSKGVPIWRRQLRSRVFITALVVVIAHVAMWLPYNIISSMRFLNPVRYNELSLNWGPILEDLIIVNSLINPLLYSYPSCS